MLRRTLAAAVLLGGAMALTAPIAFDGGRAPVATAAAPEAVLPSFAPLVKATQPAVVTIRTEVSTNGPGPTAQIDPQMREFMERFFGRDPFGGHGGGPGQRQAQGLGSGFIIDAQGVVVTNDHVIENADTITVVLSDGTEYEARMVGTDPKTDIAVLRVDAGKSLPTVPWGDSDKVEVGDWAIAIGNPFGLGGTVTAGIVSARGRSINAGPYDDFLQIDAPINRGNSGGPLFDQTGNVIGVNTAIYSPSGGSVGIGFAIPSNQARRIVADLIDDGEVERGWLGVSIQQVTDEIAATMDLDQAAGALIAEITPNGPAEKGGLKRGDVITGFGDATIETVRDLTRAVADTAPGTRTEVRVLRNGRERSITIRTGKFPA